VIPAVLSRIAILIRRADERGIGLLRIEEG